MPLIRLGSSLLELPLSPNSPRFNVRWLWFIQTVNKSDSALPSKLPSDVVSWHSLPVLVPSLAPVVSKGDPAEIKLWWIRLRIATELGKAHYSNVTQDVNRGQCNHSQKKTNAPSTRR